MKIKAIAIFQRKIAVPAAALAVFFGIIPWLTGAEADNSIMVAGLTYMLTSVLFHYLTYDVAKPGEYYFYANLGLSKGTLWSVTASAALVVYVICMAL